MAGKTAPRAPVAWDPAKVIVFSPPPALRPTTCLTQTPDSWTPPAAHWAAHPGAGAVVASTRRPTAVARLDGLLKVRVPPVGRVSLAARVGWRLGRLSLRDLAGSVGRRTLGGALELLTSGAVPRVSGALIMPMLDLQPFLAAPGEALFVT